MSDDTKQSVGSDRRYRDDVPYVLPKDLGEEERLDLQHRVLKYALKGNYVAPVGKGVTSVLDVGSGTGIWGRELALRFLSASVFGVDLEPPHADSSSASIRSLPPNYHFMQGNILQGLPFPDGTFDFTHQRLLVGGIPTHNWQRVVQELVRVTRPGGWIELLESFSVFVNAGPATERLSKWWRDLGLLRGIDLAQAVERGLGTLLMQSGLKQVTQSPIDIPTGAWNTQVGVLLEKNFLASFEALRPIACKLLPIEPGEFKAVIDALPAEWEKYHTVHRYFLAYGQA